MTALLRLLTWYACAAGVRAVVLRVPGGAGTALDAALVAALAMLQRRKRIDGDVIGA